MHIYIPSPQQGNGFIQRGQSLEKAPFFGGGFLQKALSLCALVTNAIIHHGLWEKHSHVGQRDDRHCSRNLYKHAQTTTCN